MSWLQFSDHWSSSSTTCGWSRWNAYFCSHCKFCYTTTLAACRIFYLPYFNSLHTHKGPVLLCAPPRHRAMWLNFLAQGKSLPPAGIELGTFGLQRQRFESATLATAPARHRWIAGYRSLTQPRLSADFGQLPRNAYTIAVQSGHQYRVS